MAIANGTHVPTSHLRNAIETAKAESGRPMKDFTVLAPQNDPFRVDTPARHRDGAWLADTVEELGLGDRHIHLRGMHYMVIGRPKPDGTPYTNTDSDWEWLAADAGKAARWLGYIPFDQISDQRNASPLVHEHAVPAPGHWVDAELHLELPDLDRDLVPEVEAVDFEGRQPFRLVMFGEKSSLEDVLNPIARRYQADLYLPTGEISDTLMHQMARNGADDGRPMIVLTFSDADPSGWQMPISIARKLQAFRMSLFPHLEFEVRRVALTPDQVGEYGLPSTPLKATELRGDRWREKMQVEQTEIDALASLRPQLLRQIAQDAVQPFYDDGLRARVHDARFEWQQEAQEVINDALRGVIDFDEIERDLSEHCARLQRHVDAANGQIRTAVAGLELPPIEVPTPEVQEEHGTPLVDSRWSFADQCAALIASKAYR